MRLLYVGVACKADLINVPVGDDRLADLAAGPDDDNVDKARREAGSRWRIRPALKQ